MTVDDFLAYAKELGIDGLSLESGFFESFDIEWFVDLKAKLDDHGVDRIYSWGYPDSVETGLNPDGYEDMITQIPHVSLVSWTSQPHATLILQFSFTGNALRLLP